MGLGGEEGRMVRGRWVCIFWLLVFWLGTRVLTRGNFNVSSVELVDITPCTVKSPFYYYIALGNRRLVPVSLMLQYRNIPDNNTDGPRYLGIEIHIGDGSGSNSRQRRTSLRRPIGNCLERAMAGDGGIYIVPSPPEPAILHFSTSILHSTLCSPSPLPISTLHSPAPFSSSILHFHSPLPSKTSRISGCRGNALADLAHHGPSLHSIPAFSSSGQSCLCLE